MSKNRTIISNENHYQLTTSNIVNMKMTPDTLIHTYIDKFESKNTKRIYSKSIYDFFNWLTKGEKVTLNDIRKVDPIVAQKYSNELIKDIEEGKLKKSTYNCEIKGIRGFYEWLQNTMQLNSINMKLINTNPFANIKQKKESDAVGSGYLTEKEIVKMLYNPIGENEHVKTRNKLIFILAITTGIRKEALISLQLNNIKVEEDKCYIWTFDKGEKQTKKEILEEYYFELMNWYDEDLKMRKNIKNNTIFNIAPDTAGRIISKWAKSVGINKNITFHSLRITSAIEVYKIVQDAYKVQKHMQHEEINTTEIYLDKQEDTFNYGKNIIKNIKESKTFDELLKTLSEDEKDAMLLSLNAQIKIELMNKFGK